MENKSPSLLQTPENCVVINSEFKYGKNSHILQGKPFLTPKLNFEIIKVWKNYKFTNINKLDIQNMYDINRIADQPSAPFKDHC